MNAVLITTPPKNHCGQTIQALEGGLHVLVEKPMALDIEEAFRMLKASEHRQRVLWVGFNRRFRRPYEALRRKLATVPREEVKSISFELRIDPGNWNSITPYLGDHSSGGGPLEDVASHQMDLVPWLLDQRVKALRGRRLSRGRVGEESVEYELRFADGLMAKCTAAHGRGYSESLEIQMRDHKLIGYSAGVLEIRRISRRWVDLYCRLRTVWHYSVHKWTRRPNMTLESMEKQLAAFAAAVRGEEKPVQGADARMGVQSLRLIEACRRSMKSGTRFQSLAMQGWVVP